MISFWCSLARIRFAIVVDQVMAALSRQQIDTPVTLVNTVILYEATARDNAIRLGRYFKERGLAVQSMKRRQDKSLEDYRSMTLGRHMRNLLYLKDDGRVVTAMDMVNGSADEIPIEAYE